MYNYSTNHYEQTISFAPRKASTFSTRLPRGALTRYIPLVAWDNSGQGSPMESRLHQSLAIRVSGKIQSLPVTEPWSRRRDALYLDGIPRGN